MSSSQPRSVKISDNERGGWSSDRPRRAGEAQRPPRKADVSVRGRVLAPSDRMRYSPGSLLAIACADRDLRDRFTRRVIDEQSAILSLDKVRALLAGKLPADQVEEKAQALLDAAASKRFAAGQTVVIALEGLGADERERYVRLIGARRIVDQRAAGVAGFGRHNPLLIAESLPGNRRLAARDASSTPKLAVTLPSLSILADSRRVASPLDRNLLTGNS